ncbi:MAG: MBL fold metallo-hydrolase [Bryobacteraceae bacterium]
MGAFREIISGVHVIELPLPFSLGVINVYLIRLSDGYLLLDCGMDTPACGAALENALQSLRVEERQIRQIAITHAHPDHCGFAHILVERTGAQLLMHRDDAALLARAAATDGFRAEQQQILRSGGVPEDLIARIDETFAGLRKTFRRLNPSIALIGGEVLDSAIGPLEILWTRGHSPGHICLYNPTHRMLFAGDQMIEDTTPNIGWQPGHDALGEFLISLQHLARLDIDLVLPSHGAPFRNHREWIGETTRHHEERCAEIEAALAAGAQTAHQAVSILWARGLAPFHHRLAVFEVLAHLEYLRGKGRVTAEPGAGGGLHWITCASLPRPHTM